MKTHLNNDLVLNMNALLRSDLNFVIHESTT